MFIVQLIVLQMIMFGIVIFILKKMMVGDTESAVNRLNESYAEVNKKKEELVAKMREMQEEYQKRKTEAEKVALQIKDDAEKEMREKADALIKKARAEAERIISDATNLKDRLREEIKKEEQMRMIEVCEDLLKASFKEMMRTAIDRVLIEDFLKETVDVDMSHVPPTITEMEFVTAGKLDEKTKTEIIDVVSKKIKRQMTYKESIDPLIVGGIIIKFGSLVLDGSIANKLREVAMVKRKKIEDRR